MKWLGPGRRGGKKNVDETKARQDMAELSKLLGQAAKPLPDHLKQLLRNAEQMKKQHKGL